MKNVDNILAKLWIKMFSTFTVFKIKTINTFVKNFNIFYSKIAEKLSKIPKMRTKTTEIGYMLTKLWTSITFWSKKKNVLILLFVERAF